MNRLQASWEHTALMKFYPRGLVFSWDLISAKKPKTTARPASIMECYLFKTIRSLYQFQSALYFHSLISSLIKPTADFNFYEVASRNAVPRLLPAELPWDPDTQLIVRVCLYIQKGVMLLPREWTRERGVDEILSARRKRNCIQAFVTIRELESRLSGLGVGANTPGTARCELWPPEAAPCHPSSLWSKFTLGAKLHPTFSPVPSCNQRNCNSAQRGSHQGVTTGQKKWMQRHPLEHVFFCLSCCFSHRLSWLATRGFALLPWTGARPQHRFHPAPDGKGQREARELSQTLIPF